MVNDSNNFEEIAEILVSSSKSNSNHYEYQDYDIVDTDAFNYRVIKVYMNDTKEVLGVSSTQNNAIDNSLEVPCKIYPNPCNGSFNISIDTENNIQNLQVRILDQQAKLLYDRIVDERTLSPGKYLYEIKNFNVESGTYLVIISVDDEQFTQRIIVAKN